MKKSNKTALIVLVCCIVVSTLCMIFANLIQTDFGKVKVVTASFDVNDPVLGDYYVTYKLYVPKDADASDPRPALLALHGYQNDKETSAAFAIEAARRGMVALCIDEFGHGSNSLSMKERGWTTYKIQGQSEDHTETTIKTKLSGPKRFLTMMNFSTLSFFEGSAYSTNENAKISIDADKDGLTDSSMGGIAAYNWLASQNFVQADNIAITGHSMGTWATWSTAAACQNHKAIILQCGEVFGKNIYDSENIEFHNVLMLQARYDEFNYFRDYRQETVNDDMLNSGIRDEFFTAAGRTAKNGSFTWNTTYGDFNKNTARRVELLETNHRLTTHNSHGIEATMNWLSEALGVKTNIAADNQVFLIKECLVLLAMLAVMVALCPGLMLLSNIPFFSAVIYNRTMNRRRPFLLSRGKWWRDAGIAIAIGAVTYPFMTQLGHGLLPLPEGIFRMTIGNGFMTWYMTLAIISILTMVISRASAKKKEKPVPDYYDLGLSRPEHSDKLDWELLAKGFLTALSLAACMYIIVAVYQAIFQLDLRFIWPFYKTFTLARLGQFFVYLPFFSLFFVVNVGCKLFGNMRQEFDESKPVRSFIKCWGGNVIVLLGGLLVILLLEYIPFFMGFGPGADLLFSTTFGGPFMSALILLVPQFIFFTLLSTWFERKSGNVYTGAFLSAMLAAWIVTGGSAMF
ncbi:MAG: hypothetical protein MJ124_07885 [Lachnospiraceae bacterium]|nr:hypothetical protein [Lachnospiraceae bacterium]